VSRRVRAARVFISANAAGGGGGVEQINILEIPAPMMGAAVLLDLMLDVMMNDCKQFLYPKGNTKVLSRKPLQRYQRPSGSGLE
jgi:hypothetical protein